MKLQTTKSLLLLSLIVVIGGCSTTSTHYRMTYDNTGVNPAKLKKGTACITQEFQGPVGDATIGAAAKQGNIRFVKLVEHTLEGKKNCVVVYGS